MAQVLKNLPLERVLFVQYPGVTGQPGVYSGKVAPVTSLANALFAKIRADKPFKLQAGNTGIGSVTDPHKPTASPTPGPTASGSPSPAPSLPTAELLPGIKGQSAADYTCSKAYDF
jgi:hypothetical protein